MVPVSHAFAGLNYWYILIGNTNSSILQSSMIMFSVHVLYLASFNLNIDLMYQINAMETRKMSTKQ